MTDAKIALLTIALTVHHKNTGLSFHANARLRLVGHFFQGRVRVFCCNLNVLFYTHLIHLSFFIDWECNYYSTCIENVIIMFVLWALQ